MSGTEELEFHEPSSQMGGGKKKVGVDLEGC